GRSAGVEFHAHPAADAATRLRRRRTQDGRGADPAALRHPLARARARQHPAPPPGVRERLCHHVGSARAHTAPPAEGRRGAAAAAQTQDGGPAGETEPVTAFDWLPPAKPIAGEQYFEDFALGDVFRAEPVSVTEDEIVEFARRYDPQPFHTDK